MATRVCQNDESHVETETVDATSKITTEADCELEGEITYTAVFVNEAFKEQTTTEKIAAIGHDWKDSTYTWAEDNSTVTAERVCKNDEAHTETETSETTSEITKEATYSEEGEKTYTATFTNPAFDTQVKTEAIPKLEPTPSQTPDKTPKPAPTASPKPTPTPVPTPFYGVYSGDGQTWQKGSATNSVFVFKRSQDDSLTFGSFTDILMDDEVVTDSFYIVERGSVRIALKPSYLETLAVGKHTLTARFTDGNADAAFIIKVSPGKEEGKTGNLPETGDHSHFALWAAIAVLCIAALKLRKR